MILMIYFGSFFFLFFIPAAISGALMGAIGTRLSRGRTTWFGAAISLIVGVAYVLLRDGLFGMKPASGYFSGLDVLALVNAPIPSALLAWWMHGRSRRRDERLAVSIPDRNSGR